MTPAVNLLKQKKIEHEILTYIHDPKITDFGNEAAKKLGLRANEVFKTLIVDIGKKDFVVGIVSVENMLCLKKLAKVCGVKKAMMADKKKVENSTGYLLGGVSPLGQKKKFKTFIDNKAKGLFYMYISGGKRGLDIRLKPSDLASLCDGKFYDISVS